MGNMTSKVSSVYNNPDRLLGENINYSLEYEYDRNYAHRVKRIGNRYYSYDENGNVVLEQDEPITAQDEQRYEIQELGENLYGVEYGWALENEDEQNKVGSSSVYKRRYRWNERNLMQESSENRQSVYYRYGADGQRALKSSNQSETLYFNTMWSWLHNSSAYNTERESKHIYLGSERLVTRTNGAGTQGNTYTAQVSTYYYHSDHLGSAQLITDNEGKEYERIEYTPYGEYWIEKRAPENKTLPFKFTGKERDEETGLYYYGARYLDPKTSRWLSTDPALSDYMAGSNAGAGGIYNQVNFNLYHYAGNNPIKYTDPDGKKQNLPQKLFTNALSFAAAKNDTVKGFLKEHSRIDIQRNSKDSGNNGTYYQSTAKVKVLGIPLNEVSVQSTADHPNLGENDGTLSAGDYEATMLSSSASYINAIEIQAPDFLVHPDEITNPDKREERAAQGKSNGPFSQPYSKGCQIMKLADFNETIDILHDIGFQSNDTDTIKIRIKDPKNE